MSTTHASFLTGTYIVCVYLYVFMCACVQVHSGAAGTEGFEKLLAAYNKLGTAGGSIQPCVLRLSKHGCYVDCEMPPVEAAKVLTSFLPPSMCCPTAPLCRCRSPQREQRSNRSCRMMGKWTMETRMQKNVKHI